MFNIITTFNIVLSVAPQTQQFVAQSLETFRSCLMLYTPADVQAVNDIKAGMDDAKARIQLIDPHSLKTGNL